MKKEPTRLVLLRTKNDVKFRFQMNVGSEVCNHTNSETEKTFSIFVNVSF